MPSTRSRRKEKGQIATPRELARHMAAAALELRESLQHNDASGRKPSPPEFRTDSDFGAIAQAWVYLRFCSQWRRQYEQATGAQGLVTACASAHQWLTHSAISPHDGRLSFSAIARLTKVNRELLVTIDERLSQCDLLAIFADHLDARRGGDSFSPEISFFEPFLAACDSSQRSRHALFLTPQPLAAFMVRAVDQVLCDEWRLPLGLAHELSLCPPAAEGRAAQDLQCHASPTAVVKILDPAAGTGMFLIEVVRRIYDSLSRVWSGESESRRQDLWNQYVRKSLLDRLHGCELLPAAHMVCLYLLTATLAELGVTLRASDRLQVFRRNALELSDRSFGDALANYTVVLGNPPYSRVSQDRSGIGQQLIAPYQRAVSGEPNQQPLADDYVKFMALADAVTASSPRAIVAYVTNHNWLSGVLFRGLRQTLLEHWDRFRIVDLHGHRGEIAPAEQANGNVFGIGQGIAVSIRSRDGQNQALRGGLSADAINQPAAEVHRTDLWGGADEKLQRLSTANLDSLSWQRVSPAAPLWHFHKLAASSCMAYQNWPALDACFLDYSSGLMTVRDRLAVARTREELVDRFQRFRDPSISGAEFIDAYGAKDYRNWSLSAARQAVSEDGDWLSRLTRIAYRPFDERWLFYSADIVSYPNWRIMKPLMRPEGDLQHDNLALVASRLVRNEAPAHAFVADCPVEIIFLSPKSSNNAFVFPLHLSATGSNIRPEISGGNPRRWFARAYAILNSPTYRVRFAEELRYGFARIPPLSHHELDDRLAAIGETLIAAHLAASRLRSSHKRADESPLRDNGHHKVDGQHSQVRLVGAGDPTVAAAMPRYIPRDQSIAINAQQAITGITREVWDYRVGGYAVCRSWFTAGRRTGTSRIGTRLSAAEIEHFRSVVHAIENTLACTREIDSLIESTGHWTTDR